MQPFSRNNVRPPPYSEIEHISVDDHSYVLYLANVDTSRKEEILAPSINSDASNSILIDDGEACHNLSCKKITQEIVQSYRRNKEERAELKMELDEVETEQRDMEIVCRHMEEESERCQNDSTVYEKQKHTGEKKLATSVEKKTTVKRISIELQSKLIAAENDIANRRNELSDLAKIVKTLMWKGKKVSNPDIEEKRISNMYIRVIDDDEKMKANEICETSYYTLVSARTLDSSEHTVTTTRSNLTDKTHCHIPGRVPISIKSRNVKRSVEVMDEASAITTDPSSLISLDKKAALGVINPKTYRNSVSSTEIRPFPTFTQPNRWGKCVQKLRPIDSTSSLLRVMIQADHSISERSQKLQTSADDLNSKDVDCAMNLSGGVVKKSESPSGRKTLNVENISTRITRLEQRASKKSAWQLLDPIFFLEKARVSWKRNDSIGALRALTAQESKFRLLKSDELTVGSDFKSRTSGASMSPTNRALTDSCVRAAELEVRMNSTSKATCHWRVGGKKVVYLGRPPSAS